MPGLSCRGEPMTIDCGLCVNGKALGKTCAACNGSGKITVPDPKPTPK